MLSQPISEDLSDDKQPAKQRSKIGGGDTWCQGATVRMTLAFSKATQQLEWLRSPGKEFGSCSQCTGKSLKGFNQSNA